MHYNVISLTIFQQAFNAKICHLLLSTEWESLWNDQMLGVENAGPTPGKWLVYVISINCEPILFY